VQILVKIEEENRYLEATVYINSSPEEIWV